MRIDGDKAPFQSLSLFDAHAVPVGTDSLGWVPLRRSFGIRSFGTNAFRAACAGDAVIEDHVESPGQEELYVVLRGRARLTVGEESVDASAGTAVFVSQPEVRRSAVALEDDTVVLAVGGWPDQAYHPLPWEPIYLAQESMRGGDWAAAAETLEREAGDQRDTAPVQFRLACCHAQLGRHELAVAELLRAIALNPKIGRLAAGEEALSPLRGLEGSPLE